MRTEKAMVSFLFASFSIVIIVLHDIFLLNIYIKIFGSSVTSDQNAVILQPKELKFLK